MKPLNLSERLYKNSNRVYKELPNPLVAATTYLFHDTSFSVTRVWDGIL